ncbi:Transposable element P transposase [Oopsacas minuta]|uniref:Transposable element P transposase n=1 Tax=Oopsacas minuta TaxID=111878 RepID=A0AAV7JWR7_9METZ|nr:Transposable element P transposase [Oopsacas minuta]
MSGAQYNISILQILESERKLKLSSILKLFQKETDREMSLKDFIKTFSSEEVPVEIHPIEDFLSLLDNCNLLPEVYETTLLALAFVAGYAIRSTYSKYKDRCGECFASLTKQRDIHLEEQFIQITDRGGLKYPALEVLESCILLWKIFTAIEVQPILFNKFVHQPLKN